MTIQDAVVCNRCKDVVLLTAGFSSAPKGWQADANEVTHTCPRCLKTLTALHDFLEWLPGKLCELVKADGNGLWAPFEAFDDVRLDVLWDEFKAS